MALPFLAEGVREPGEAAGAHTDAEVLALLAARTREAATKRDTDLADHPLSGISLRVVRCDLLCAS
jgi:hypothetical protein